MESETDEIMKIAKKVIEKRLYNKLSTIKDKSELKSYAKHAMISALENEDYLLKKKIQYMKNYGKDVFFIENMHILIESKIKHFKASFSMQDYEKVAKIISNVKQEIVNVQSIKSV